MKTKRVLALAAALLSLVAATPGISAVGAPDTLRPSLTGEELVAVRLQDVIDVTSQSRISSAGGVESRIAASVVDVLGPETSEWTWLAATASQFVDDRPRAVVVVLVRGGLVPFDGPAGRDYDPSASVAGMVFDAETGEFLRGFMF